VEKLYKAWRDKGVAFFYVYTREPHPGFLGKEQTKTVEERKANAKQCEKDLGMTPPWLIDDMRGAIQRAYGGLPNSAYVITREGKVYYKEAWADAKNLDEQLRKLLKEQPVKSEKEAIADLEKDIAGAKDDPGKRAELGAKLAQIATEDACKTLIKIFTAEKDLQVQVKLVEAFIHTKQKKCIEFLISLLNHAREEVRAAAFAVIRKYTGETLDYDPKAGRNDRERAVEKWEAWWKDSEDRLVWSDEKEQFVVREKKEKK